MSERLLESWPWTIGDVDVEPGTGTVVVRPRGRRPATISADDARELADHAPARVCQVLRAAAAEADRQAFALVQALEGASA